MLFEKLSEIVDPEPHSAALNMALDETLLRTACEPLLRIYGWARPAVSFGHFGKFAEVEKAWPGRDWVRRWTGGGSVPHGEDFTYTLIVPRAHACARLTARESYRLIHEQIARLLRAAGSTVSVATAASIKVSAACFDNAVEFDVLTPDGKVAGAAQRRTLWGLLHQGSIQLPGLHGAFGHRLAESLASETSRREISAAEIDAAHEVSARKYATENWLRRF